jgi:malate dehydrogenase (oxaloacetate-decarboxylating)(NADP+)
MMVEMQIADAMVSGVGKSYPETIRPILQIISMKQKYKYAAGLYVMILKDRTLFFADTTVNIDPSAEALAEIALQAAERVEFFNIQPRIAMLGFSNFGSTPHALSSRMQEAVELVRKKRPELMIDGEMQADTAVSLERLADYSFSSLKEPANVLIFPNLASGNIAYKLLQHLGRADVIGPILLGPSKPVHVLQQGSSVEEILRISTIAAAEANTETLTDQPHGQMTSSKKSTRSHKISKRSSKRMSGRAQKSQRKLRATVRL